MGVCAEWGYCLFTRSLLGVGGGSEEGERKSFLLPTMQ